MDWVTLVGGGLLIGLLVAAPIGPVNLICIRRTLAYGQLNGFLAGLGAALGDGIFAVVAGFGVKWVFDAIQDMGVVLQLGSAALLMIYGLRVFILCDAARDHAQCRRQHSVGIGRRFGGGAGQHVRADDHQPGDDGGLCHHVRGLRRDRRFSRQFARDVDLGSFGRRRLGLVVVGRDLGHGHLSQDDRARHAEAHEPGVRAF